MIKEHYKNEENDLLQYNVPFQLIELCLSKLCEVILATEDMLNTSKCTLRC